MYMSRCRSRERADIVFHNADVGRPRLTYQWPGASTT